MRETVKYRLLWKVGTALSFFLYYSGITTIYLFFRKAVFKQYRSIVLTYHCVRDDGRHADMAVSVRQFERQLNYLKKKFDVVTLFNAVQSIKQRECLSSDVATITFDDGYMDNFTHAFPLLQRYKTPATIFLISDQVDRSDQMLNIAQIKTMQAHYIDFGSHTVSHPILSDLPSEKITKEIQQSKKDLESALGTPIRLFAYPKGKSRHYNAEAQKALKEAGYIAAFTTENGPLKADERMYELNRNGIRNCPLFVFKVRLSGIFESRPAMLLRKICNMT